MRRKAQLALMFFYVGFFSFGFSKEGNGAVVDDEASVLLSIKSSLSDPLNKLQNWRFSEVAHCNWTGIWCSNNGVVERLDLSGMNLSGNVSDNIGKLSGLVYLNLSNNGFSFTLSKSISNLPYLESLDVSQNFFVGSFPFGFERQGKLTQVNGSSNNFSGYIPENVRYASGLEILDLRGNYFIGSIPRSMGRLQRLKFLGLSGNNFTGEIPYELGQIVSLETMILGYNGFEGRIPSSFGNLRNLKYLDLAVGVLKGTVPSEFGNLEVLETLYLYQNKFEGEIPSAIGNMTSLQFLDISDNMMSGQIPSEIGKLKNLRTLNLMCNKLSGSVPVDIGGLSQLEVLELWNNSLSGPLPSELGRKSKLQWVDLSSNMFLSEIPKTLCKGGNLKKLILFNNQLSGSIPTELMECSSLVRVRMQNNLLSGSIPDDLAGSSSLTFIDLSKNNLHGFLPSAILSITNLQSFIVSNNQIEGEIPDEFRDCSSLSVLDLSSNGFSGNIPSSIRSCNKLVEFSVRNNRLTGKIPQEISTMAALAILDLSNNSLTGGLPENIGLSPALEVINISFNKLQGEVPSNGIMKTINIEDLEGNPDLCGGVLPPCELSDGSEIKNLHKKRVVRWLIGISSGLAVVLTLIAVRLSFKKWRSNRAWVDEKYGSKEWPWRLMGFQRLDFTSGEILACIKETNVIGMGANGVVYRADIARINTAVAVKKLWRSEADFELGFSNSNFEDEVNLLGNLRHRNVVRLLGFLHNNSDMMLIYEFMKNGSLGEVLHGKKEKQLLVDWVARYNIAVGMAHGLAYLHHDCHPPIIHRDIKSNNILLDGNLEPRIADFGLAKTMNRSKETVSAVAGSYGYIAPEYGYSLRIDEKIDIYSFGVVLLELVTGKPPLDAAFGESVNIVEWLRWRIRSNLDLEEALDPIVGKCKFVQEEMILVMKIAILCTAKFPKERPSMRDVITMLGEAKPRRKNNCNTFSA